MKKVVIPFLAMFLVFSLSSCQTGNDDKAVPQSSKETNHEADEEKGPYNKVSTFMEEESRKVFSPYYELLDFTISDYQEEIVEGNVEATFGYKVIYKNFDKDPDTVGYIQEAKAKGDPHYQQLYDEYLQPKEMNFEWKAVIDATDSITLYANVNPKGTKWEKAEMSDFILTKE